MLSPSIIERAYELARSGQFRDASTIAKQLKVERYEAVDSHFGSRTLRMALQGLCKASLLANTTQT